MPGRCLRSRAYRLNSSSPKKMKTPMDVRLHVWGPARSIWARARREARARAAESERLRRWRKICGWRNNGAVVAEGASRCRRARRTSNAAGRSLGEEELSIAKTTTGLGRQTPPNSASPKSVLLPR